MLLVRTTVKASKIHGLGVFAAEPIAKGTTIWAFDPVLDRIIRGDELAALPDHVAEFLEHYCEYFPETDELVLSGDNDRYTNHSDDPNTAVEGANGTHATVLATRSIRPDEEITCDYAVIRSRKWASLAVTA
jgi:SET domain-containing protein